MSKTNAATPPKRPAVARKPVAKAPPTAQPVPAAKPRDFQHPLLEQARQLARQGKPLEAAKVMEDLAAQVPPFEQAQLLAHAANFCRGQDRKRAVELAQRATELRPDLPQAWLALSFALDEKQDRKGAIAAGLKVLETKATPAQLVDVGRHLSRLGQDKAALEAVKRGFAESGEALNLASFTLRVALQCADWELADRITARFRTEHAAGHVRECAETPRTHLLWCDDEAINIQVISSFAERTFAAHPPLVTQPWPGGKGRKLRIGYLSSDYRDHATSLLALGMMRHHDRDRFELYAYCTSYDDGSALRRDMLNRFDVARSFRNANDRKAAEQIVADRIDILVDLNGLTEGTRHGVLAWHPAPIQMSWLGFPGTCGGRFVEYIIGDDYTVPHGAEKLFPEKVIRIPPTYQINDYAARWLPPAPSRRKLGLPEGRPVIGMFNNVNKVGSQVWDTWMQVLRGVPEAVFWMLDPGAVARVFLLSAAKAAGVDPARIIYAAKAKQEAHIARLQQCDLVLDPWPYGGHTTTGDALFAGVPVVALEGCNFASRVSGGLLHAAGLPILVRTDIVSYVQTAVGLLKNPTELAKIRRYLKVRWRKRPVFDALLRTRQIEAAYLAAYDRLVKGLPPDHLLVKVNPKPASAAAKAKEAS
jgi:predicted O-linked N-acetylglucosamine transferase (SPINDLY family)